MPHPSHPVSNQPLILPRVHVPVSCLERRQTLQHARERVIFFAREFVIFLAFLLLVRLERVQRIKRLRALVADVQRCVWCCLRRSNLLLRRTVLSILPFENLRLLLLHIPQCRRMLSFPALVPRALNILITVTRAFFLFDPHI